MTNCPKDPNHLLVGMSTFRMSFVRCQECDGLDEGQLDYEFPSEED